MTDKPIDRKYMPMFDGQNYEDVNLHLKRFQLRCLLLGTNEQQLMIVFNNIDWRNKKVALASTR